MVFLEAFIKSFVSMYSRFYFRRSMGAATQLSDFEQFASSREHAKVFAEQAKSESVEKESDKKVLKA